MNRGGSPWRSWPRPRRASAVVLLAAGVGLLGIAGFAADDGLVYYRTPTETVHADAGRSTDRGLDPRPVRVGGMVVRGSVHESAEESTLLLTDGATEVEVRYPGRLPDVVREGEGAVVEGRWDSPGVLRGEQLLMRHSNEYRAPEEPGG